MTIEHFQKRTVTELLQDNIFLQEMHNNIHNEPTIVSRAFQLALEVTYSKRKFKEEALQNFYKNDFIVKDIFNVNHGLCDQSTIYTSMITKIFTNYMCISPENVVVNSTPLYMQKENITTSMQALMDYYKLMTGNSCPDLFINKRPYDLKDVKNISFGKNQIYLIDIEFINTKGFEILKKLEKSIADSINNNINLSQETRSFSKIVLANLKNHRELETSPQIRFEMLCQMILKDIPKDFQMPIFIPIKKPKIESFDIVYSILDNIPLDKGHLDYVKAKKAIMGVLITYGIQHKYNIQEITHNSITFNKTDLDNID